MMAVRTDHELSLECPTCNDQLTVDGPLQPKLLKCGHTFCTDCIQKFKTGKNLVQCPYCFGVTLIGEMGIYALPVNMTLVDSLSKMNLQEDFKGVYSGKEVCPIKSCKPLLKIFDHHGGKLIIEEHDITITVPELAVSKGQKVEMQAVASLTGPYSLPEDYKPISVFVWIGSDYRFKKPVKVRIPHFAFIQGLDDNFDVAVLTANKHDLITNENGDSVLQMHKSVYDYQYEVNDDYCDYYTDYFCSKCLAKSRSFISRLFSGFSSPREFCNTRITVREYYEKEKMLLKHTVAWNIPIDDQKCQTFCLSYNECPGWTIEPVGSREIEVNQLDFRSCDPEDLKAEEEIGVYPPRFKVTVNHDPLPDKTLKIVFKISIESDANVSFDQVQKFPLSWPKLTKEIIPDQPRTKVPSSPAVHVPIQVNRPNMHQLQKVMTHEGVTTNWHNFGLELAVSENILSEIETNHGHDVSVCCRVMFQKWLARTPDANWEQLVAALKNIGLHTAADFVSRQYSLAT